ncbi:MAG: hypothetical protein AB7O56_07530 [Bauldia sp.]
MKLPLDDRSDGFSWQTPLPAPAEAAASSGHFRGALAMFLHGLWRRFVLAVEPHESCDIPDALREDAGLAPREPERRIDWWDIR